MNNPTETWLYVVGDGKSPEEYIVVDGVYLCTEGAGKLDPSENPQDAAREMSKLYEGSEIAIVEHVLDAEWWKLGEVIEMSILGSVSV
jgi:hypothetical protein